MGPRRLVEKGAWRCARRRDADSVRKRVESASDGGKGLPDLAERPVLAAHGREYRNGSRAGQRSIDSRSPNRGRYPCPRRTAMRDTRRSRRRTFDATARMRGVVPDRLGEAGTAPRESEADLLLERPNVVDQLPALGLGEGCPGGHRAAAGGDFPEEAPVTLRLHLRRSPVRRLRIERGRARPVPLARLAVTRGTRLIDRELLSGRHRGI